MRLIYTGHESTQALKLSEFLKREGVENLCEIVTNRDWGSPSYGDIQASIWVIDEDQTEIAERWVDEFENHPDNPLFSIEKRKIPAPPPVSEAKRGLGIATLILLMACSLLFLWGESTAPTEEVSAPKIPATPLYMPLVYKELLFDYPKAFSLIDKLIKAYGRNKLNQLPKEGQVILKQFEATPYWQGIYEQLVVHLKHPEAPWNFSAPLFERIREGEVWRLVTPIFLHANIFHLFFNMLWLILLGKLIEDRIGTLRYLLLVIAIAIVSNTAQYLMSGPNFLGISGVIVGMLGFIWSRQHLAAWEGYRITSGVFTFMLSFILGVAFLQFLAFIQEAFWEGSSFPAIASTAHLVGGFVGWFLGRFELLRMRAP